MGTRIANGDSRPAEPLGPSGLSFWPRVREFAVPASMIETATARRLAGDWAGACSAAGVEVDLNLRSLARDHGRELAARVRDDLRHLAPDLLRWHMPRVAPDGLLRPGLTLALAKYGREGREGGRPVYLVVRTAPAWAAANPRSSAADGWELSAPLANRFVHLQWTHDHEVVVRGLGGTWPRATLPRLDPEKLPEAVEFARRAVGGLLSGRPALVHRLPNSETRRGGPWPSPRSWEMTQCLVAFATAAGVSREVLSLLVRGTVGDGPGLELLAAVDRMDLPDPEVLLADPAGAELPERGDLRQAALDGVVEAVRVRPDKSRWDAAWALLVRAVETGAPDLVVVPAGTLASLRQEDWDVPAAIERLAGVVSLSRRADHVAARTATAAAEAGRR
ncbi:hypothetical protein ABIE67_004916 [Streptomyces sp. V4I8]|uniref:AAA family ATPase n=1 Tax=Streptomyces sp. V4I8 TaxID=3156469 RepID=UPI0035195BA4